MIRIPRAIVVVDASLVAMWVVSERYSSLALALAEDWARAKVEMLAPCLMLAEATSAVYKRVRRGELSVEQAQQAMQVLFGFGVRLEDEPGLYQRGLELAHHFHRPTPYDALYLALAELRGSEFWTGDERLYNAVHTQLPWVHCIAHYSSGGGLP